MIHELEGARVLLTGASRGIGVFIARALAAERADLVLTARDGDGLEAVAAECRAAGAPARTIRADVSDDGDRGRLVAESGDLDVLVNNAGVEYPIRLVDQTPVEIRRQLEVNLAAPIDLVHRVLPGMIARGRGAIVNVSSMSGKSATPFNSVYAATKHGLNGFTSSLAIELEGTGVHAGVVCPGFVATAGMWASFHLRAPWSLREVPPERVAEGVLQVARGASEVLVTRGPMRPLLALRELFPGVAGAALRWMGIKAALARRADLGTGSGVASP